MSGDDTCLCKHHCHNSDERCIKPDCGCIVCCCYDCEESRYGDIRQAPIDLSNPPHRQWETIELNSRGVLKALNRPTYPVVIAFYNVDNIAVDHTRPEFEKLAATMSPPMFYRTCLTENPSLINTFDIESVPTFILFSRTRALELHRWEGPYTAETLGIRITERLASRRKR